MASAKDDNYFKDLGEETPIPSSSGSSKRKRKMVKATNTLFNPTPAESYDQAKTNTNARYIIVEGVEKNGKKEDISKMNPFLVSKTIEGLSTGVLALRALRSGSYSVLMRNQTEATKVMLGLKKIGNTAVLCRDDDIANTSKGVIRATHLKFLSDEDILTGLKEKNPLVKAVRQFRRREGGEDRPTGRFLVSFNTTTTPRNLIILYEKFDVERWYPNPLRCRKCLNFRHHEERCTSEEKICKLCAHPEITGHDCTRRDFCVSCKGVVGHTTMAPNCPSFRMEKEICRMMVDRHMSGFQSRKQWHKENPGFNTMLKNLKESKGKSSTNTINQNTNIVSSVEATNPTNRTNTVSFAYVVAQEQEQNDKTPSTSIQKQHAPLPNTINKTTLTKTETKKQEKSTKLTILNSNNNTAPLNPPQTTTNSTQKHGILATTKTQINTNKQKNSKNSSNENSPPKRNENKIHNNTTKITNNENTETNELTLNITPQKTPEIKTTTVQTTPTTSTSLLSKINDAEAWNALLSHSPSSIVTESTSTPTTLSHGISPLNDTISLSDESSMEED